MGDSNVDERHRAIGHHTGTQRVHQLLRDERIYPVSLNQKPSRESKLGNATAPTPSYTIDV